MGRAGSLPEPTVGPSSVRAPFLGLFLLLASADTLFTLLGQPTAYWTGDRSCAVEFSPVFRQFLLSGPWAFFFAAMLATAFLAVGAYCVNKRFAASVFFLGSVTHFVGAASWLVRIPTAGVPLVVLLAVSARSLAVREWPRFIEVARGEPSEAPTGTS